jgi:protein TonB
MKQIVIGSIAALIGFSLFVVMQLMIKPDMSLFAKKSDHTYLNFVRVKPNDRIAETKERKLPDEPPPPEQPPQTPDMTVPHDAPAPTSAKLAMQMPTMSMPLNTTGGPVIGNPAGAGGDMGQMGVMDSEVIPIMQVPAKYPRKAKLAKLEGYVKLEIVIRPDGTVSTAKVVDSNPKRLFDKSAKDAILRWKFKPKVENGQPVQQKAIQVLEFKLSK